MTGNLKALGLALLAICALGAVAAQGALAVDHDFHAEEETIGVTGKSLKAETFQVGAAGTVSCATSKFESTQKGVFKGVGTYETDEITVIPRTTDCTFGGQPATVNFNHCAYRFDSDTTFGNPTGGEHANLETECSGGSEIEIHTAVCTITIGPQLVKHAVRYENKTPSSITVYTTAKKVKTGKKRNTATQPANGCLTFPTGEIGTFTGESTYECFKDESGANLDTAATTPVTKHGETKKCTIAPA